MSENYAPDQTPSSIGRYEITGTLGFGAMGAVYKAFDPIIKRDVAIKTIRLDVPPGSPQRATFKDRFYQEVRISGTLSHPNIVTLFDVGEENDQPFLAMEYVEGRTLSGLLEAGTKFGPERVARIVSQVASALDYAHSRGVVHRDIKPANLIVQEGDTVKVTDFGIAKLLDSGITQTGSLLGTPSYMSPEQAMGEPLDGRSDIFSLGVCAFEMLSGEQPFPGNNVTSILYRLVHVDPVEPATLDMAGVVPHLWREVFHKVLAKRPEGRYEKASLFVQGLQECLGAVTAAADEATVALPTPGEATVTLEAPRLEGRGETAVGAADEDTLIVHSAADGPGNDDSQTVALEPRPGGHGAAPGPTVSMDVTHGTTAAGSNVATLPPERARANRPLGLSTTWLLGGAATLFLLAASTVIWILVSRGRPVQPAPASPIPAPVAQMPEAPTVGTLLLETEPSGAQVSLNGEARGITPLELEEVPFGEHEVQLALQGYTTQSHDVSLSADNPTARLQATMEKRPQPTTGTASITSTPPGATVFVDGRPVGQAPINGMRLQPGEHDVALTLEGHDRWSGSVKVVAGRRARLEAELVPTALAPPTPEPVDTARIYENRDGAVDHIARRKSGSSPSYPADRAGRLKKGDRVSVALTFLVNTDGSVEDVEVTESAGKVIDDLVTSAVREWTYEPATIRGTPVRVRVRLRQTFLGS